VSLFLRHIYAALRNSNARTVRAYVRHFVGVYVRMDFGMEHERYHLLRITVMLSRDIRNYDGSKVTL